MAKDGKDATAKLADKDSGSSSSKDGIDGDNFTKLMEAIQASRTQLDNKLAKFKEELLENQEKAATSAVRKVRQEPYSFKKKSHQEQFRLNEKVDEALLEAETELGTGPATTSAVKKAQEAIATGRKLIAERQKLIKIADRSDLGWAVVAEYTADELAEDSDDEKRLEKAERAAERRAAKRKKTAPERRTKPYSRPQQSQQLQAATPSTPAFMTPVQKRSLPITPLPQRQSGVGPCFACGLYGHLRSYCPKIAGSSSSTKSWYPFVDNDDGVSCEDQYVSELHVSIAGMQHDHGATESALCEIDVSEFEPVCVDDAKHFSEIPPPECCVKGRLKENSEFWREELKAPANVLNVIENGYVLPLKSMPDAYVQKNQLSAEVHADFVQDSIDELLATKCVTLLSDRPYICSPLSVVQNSMGKKRLVINLRYLNRHLWKQKFKYEDLRTAMLLFKPGDYMFSFDLKSGYHHVDIADVHHKYLGFEWHGTYYAFTVLPFGLSTACYIFTKMLRPLVRYWRARGIRITLYLDDGLAVVTGKQQASEASQFVKVTLSKAGFIAHPNKSKWEPVERLSWLGFVIDMAVGQIEVPEEKLSALKELTRKVLDMPEVPARLLACLVGKIISLGLAIGAVSRFMTRSLYSALESRVAWCDKIVLSSDARAELEFWDKCIADYKAQPIWHSPSAVRFVYSDASDTGYGGYVVEHGPCTATGQWSAEEAKQSSTWRELTAVLNVLRSVMIKLRNMRVRWFTDNQNVARILQVGSRQEHLQKIALDIFFVAIHNHIKLEPEWIPRELNEQADYLSRIVDYDDWQLNPLIFSELNDIWGPYTIDRFADNINAQLARFNSRYGNPGSEAVDAFTVNWAGENNWLCPPVTLISRVIRHAQVCSAAGTLVVPAWPSAPFWPILCPMGSQFADFVKEVIELPLSEKLFLPSRSGAVLFGGNEPNTPVYALRCQF